MNKIYTYLNSNLNLKKDLEDYYNAIGIPRENKQLLNNYTINYIFERRLGTDKKTVFDFVLADLFELDAEEKDIVLAMKNSIDGVFEVRKIAQDKFELFNIVNEKKYIVRPMEKMTKFKNLSVGHFLLARLLFIDNEYFLYHIVDHVNYSNRAIAFQIAVSRLAQNPALFYFDNQEKLEELKVNSKNICKKFNAMFASDFVTTSNKNVDELVSLLNEYIEGSKKPTKAAISNLISPVTVNSYFDVSSLQSGSNIFTEAKKGFSGQDKEYNVSLLADEQSGLLVLPFMDLFLKIIEADDYRTIENYKECVLKFVTDNKITPLALKVANSMYPDKFLPKINEILETQFNSLDEIMQQYKSFYVENSYTSSATTLYSSYAFKKLMNVMDEQQDAANVAPNQQKVGRNDPCPCGSGKKYKKCCGVAVQI